MPSWLGLLLFVIGTVAWVGLLAAGQMADWRFFRVAVRHFGIVLLALAVPAALAGLCLFMWPPMP